MSLLTGIIDIRFAPNMGFLLLWRKRPFLSDKYDITQHPNYKYTSDFDKKYTFDIEKYLNRRMKLKAEEEFDVIQA